VALTVNSPPTVTAPSSASLVENTTLTFSTAGGNAITLTDATASGNSDSLTLAVSHGTLTLASPTGLIFSGAPNGSAKFTVTGALANLNAALNGLVYKPNSVFTGSDTLTISVTDSGDGLSGLASVAITVLPKGIGTGVVIGGTTTIPATTTTADPTTTPATSTTPDATTTTDDESILWAGVTAAVEVLNQ
jgi:hypothetical protein